MTNHLLRRAFAAMFMAAAFVSPALAADWREQFPEIRIGISSSENEADAIARNEPYAAYLTKKLGVPVKIVRGTDYAAVIEAMRSENIEFATVGPANYALARKVMGDGVTAIATSLDKDGNKGYYSILVVKADSPYQKLEDVAGKNFAFADPNSASGYAIPSYYLRQEGHPAEEFFGNVAFSGGHEQSIVALMNGTFDVVATFWNNETSGNVQRMEGKGMIPKGSTRIIWKSPLIPGSPTIMRTDLPEDLKKLFTDALFAFPKEDAEAFKALNASSGSLGYAPATHADYVDIIAVTEANAAERRAKAN